LTEVGGGRGVEAFRLEGKFPMNLIKLEAVRHHTRRELTPAEARRLVASANLSVLKAQAAALSLHPWLNTAQEWLQLEACLVLIEERRRNRTRAPQRQ
jgi:hypothetical protein